MTPLNKKLKYNTGQNLWHVLKLTWAAARGMLLYTIGTAVLTLCIAITDLTIAPVILSKVEASVPLPELLGTIALFTLLLLLLCSMRNYLKSVSLAWSNQLLHHQITSVFHKECATSYPNRLSSRFQAAMKECYFYIYGSDGSYEQMLREFGTLLSAVMGFILYLTLLSRLQPLLLVLVIVTTAVSFLVSQHVQKWDVDHREERKSYRSRTLFVCNTIMANELPKDIRIFRMQPWLNEIHNKALGLFQAFCRRRQLHFMLGKLADLILSLARNGIAYWYLISLALDKGLPASEFLLYFSAVSGFTAWITDILNSITLMRFHSTKICEARELLEWPEPFRFEGGQTLEPESTYELRLVDVSYRYPEAEADTISHMDLTLHPGEKLAIVGLNGAGKTTLVKLLCGLLDPTEGRVLLNGQDIRAFNRREYYGLFTAVFQDFSWLETSLASNVAQSITDIDRERVLRSVHKAGMDEVIAKLPKGIDTHLGNLFYDDAVELSGGELQRLMLARALYKDAPVLILDEPTAALDPIAESDIYQRYNEMTAGRTSVYISHRLASTQFCDRVLFLEQGKIKEQGSHQALMALGGGYAHLFEVQSRYYQEGGERNEV